MSSLKKLVEQAEKGDFIVSSKPLPGNEVVPIVPINNLARQGYIDSRTPRAYLGSDLSSLLGISCPDSFGQDKAYGLDSLFYVYSPAEEFATVTPSKEEDVVAFELGLDWVITRVQATLIGCIKVTDVDHIKLILMGDSIFQYPIFNFKWVQIPENEQ